MKKKAIRSTMLAQLKSVTPMQRQQMSQEMTTRLIETAAFQKARVLATYLSMPHEWDTLPLIQAAQAAGKQVVIPKTFPGGRMVFVPYESEHLVRTRFGLLEPGVYHESVDKSVIDWMQVPGLAWNSDGFRVGYGGGYYDRYLADFEGHTVSVFAAFQLLPLEPEPFDQAVSERIIL